MSQIVNDVSTAKHHQGIITEAADCLSNQSLSEGETDIQGQVESLNAFRELSNSMVRLSETMIDNAKQITEISESLVSADHSIAMYGGGE